MLALCDRVLLPFIRRLSAVLHREFARVVEFLSVSFVLKNGLVFWVTDINVQRKPFVADPKIARTVARAMRDAQRNVVTTVEHMLARKAAKRFTYVLLRQSLTVSPACSC